MESIRADVAELRHEMQLGFARADARAAATDAKFEAMLTAMDVKFTGLMATGHARTEALLEKGLREQTRFFFLAWSVLLAAIVGLYAR